MKDPGFRQNDGDGKQRGSLPDNPIQGLHFLLAAGRKTIARLQRGV
jgi:hypothetical protein